MGDEEHCWGVDCFRVEIPGFSGAREFCICKCDPCIEARLRERRVVP